jgi:hypothetical protein
VTPLRITFPPARQEPESAGGPAAWKRVAMASGWRLNAVAVVTMALLGGCSRPWRPTQIDPDTAHAAHNLCSYLAMPAGRCVYLRTELDRDEASPPREYARTVSHDRFSEGLLDGVRFEPLHGYLRDDEEENEPAAGRTPQPPPPFGRRGFSFYMRLAEPLAPIPPGIGLGEPVSDSTDMYYYTAGGRHAESGWLTRTAELEGFEDVETPAGRFEGCLRARVELSIWFPLGPVANLTSYVWLTKDGYEVRRVQRLSGWLLIFRFRSAHEFLLKSYGPQSGASTAPGQAGESGLVQALTSPWESGAFMLERLLPAPQIGGMLGDLIPATGRHTPGGTAD